MCLDDKHRVKVGEPDTTFEVGDHDFSKFSIIPLLSPLVDIPAKLSGSWYYGLVTVALKDCAFEPSSPHRHMTKLFKMLSSNAQLPKLMLCVYTDGGPDLRATYNSVKSLIGLSQFELFTSCHNCTTSQLGKSSWMHNVNIEPGITIFRTHEKRRKWNLWERSTWM